MILHMLKIAWQELCLLPRSTYILAICISSILCWETAQIIKKSNSFQPNSPIPMVSTLHSLFLPSSPSDHSNLNPKVDWYGLEEHLYYCPITVEQSSKLAEIEDKAINIIDKALSIYSSITDCLTDEQIAILLKPQENVASSYSLGLDCGTREHQLLSLYNLKKCSEKLRDLPDADTALKATPKLYERTPQDRQKLANLDPTRLLVSLDLLLKDPKYAPTPQQATAILRQYSAYCKCLSELYRTHDKALRIFTPEQIQKDNGLAPRIWESSSSPVALRETRALIVARIPGGKQ